MQNGAQTDKRGGQFIMEKEHKQYSKTTTEHLTLENSFGIIRENAEVKLNCTVGIKDHTYGWFEVFDDEDNEGQDWHAEGGLWFDNWEVTDYDGVFSLPKGVIELLKENGYNTEEVE
jgi:hypothetical protein